MSYCLKSMPACALSLVLCACASSAILSDVSDPVAEWRVQAWQADPISSPQFESHPALDARRSTLYFVRSSPTFSGWRILESECRDGHWQAPRAASFAGDGVEADPFVTSDGKTLYFISSRSEDGVRQNELDIWRTDRARISDPWELPVRLPDPVNSAGSEWFPRPAADGWLYFGSNRPGGHGLTDIYRAREREGGWQVENLGPGVNGPGDEYEAEISRDGQRMILMADGDLFLVTRSGQGWGNRRKLGPEINTEGLEVGPAFSPSGRSFLFARDFGQAALPMGGSGELVLARSGPGEAWPKGCA